MMVMLGTLGLRGMLKALGSLMSWAATSETDGDVVLKLNRDAGEVASGAKRSRKPVR